MRPSIIAVPRTHPRLSSPLVPGLICLLACGIVPRSADAFTARSANPASPELMATATPPGDPPTVTRTRSGSPDLRNASDALYYKGIAEYGQSNYPAASRDLKKYIAASDPAKLGQANLFMGYACSAAGDYERAVAAFTSYIWEHPEDESHAALGNRAYAYLMLHKDAEAIADYKTYLIFQPGDKTAWNNYVAALTRQREEIDDADIVDALNEAITNDPDNLAIRSSLASLQIRLKEYAAAIKQYDAILAKSPEDSRARYNRAVAYGLTRDNARAAADFEAYTKLKPDDADSWNNLGVFRGLQKDYRGAIAVFARYIALKPDDANLTDVYRNRGIAYFALGEWRNSEIDLRRYDAAKPGDSAIMNLIVQAAQNGGDDATGPHRDLFLRVPRVTDPDAWFNMGLAYYSKKQYELAIEAYTKSNTLRPDAQTLFNRALAYYYLGEKRPESAYADAEADAAAALALKPAYPDALLVKTDAEYAEQKYAVAAADYFKYVAMPGISAENKLYAQKRMLQSSINNKDFVGAITATTSLIQSNPAEPQNYFIRGTAYVATTSFDSAILDLEKFAGMKSDDSMGFYNLGLAYTGKKDNVNAAAAYVKAWSVKPDNYDAAEQAGTAFEALADGDQTDAAKSAEEYDKSIQMYERASKIRSATPRQQSDSLYNEAAAIEAKARRERKHDSLSPAIDVWKRWLQLAANDPEFARITRHIIDLQATLAIKR